MRNGTETLNILQATDAESGESVFVKQAPEFVAIFGPDGLPLTSARMQQEHTLAWSISYPNCVCQ